MRARASGSSAGRATAASRESRPLPRGAAETRSHRGRPPPRPRASAPVSTGRRSPSTASMMRALPTPSYIAPLPEMLAQAAPRAAASIDARAASSNGTPRSGRGSLTGGRREGRPAEGPSGRSTPRCGSSSWRRARCGWRRRSRGARPRGEAPRRGPVPHPAGRRRDPALHGDHPAGRRRTPQDGSVTRGSRTRRGASARGLRCLERAGPRWDPPKRRRVITDRRSRVGSGAGHDLRRSPSESGRAPMDCRARRRTARLRGGDGQCGSAGRRA